MHTTSLNNRMWEILKAWWYKTAETFYMPINEKTFSNTKGLTIFQHQYNLFTSIFWVKQLLLSKLNKSLTRSVKEALRETGSLKGRETSRQVSPRCKLSIVSWRSEISSSFSFRWACRNPNTVTWRDIPMAYETKGGHLAAS